MSFLVLSPGLAHSLVHDRRRNRLAQSTLYAFDQAVHHAERRMRESHAAVWRLPKQSAIERKAMQADLAALRESHQVDLARQFVIHHHFVFGANAHHWVDLAKSIPSSD